MTIYNVCLGGPKALEWGQYSTQFPGRWYIASVAGQADLNDKHLSSKNLNSHFIEFEPDNNVLWKKFDSVKIIFIVLTFPELFQYVLLEPATGWLSTILTATIKLCYLSCNSSQNDLNIILR